MQILKDRVVKLKILLFLSLQTLQHKAAAKDPSIRVFGPLSYSLLQILFLFNIILKSSPNTQTHLCPSCLELGKQLIICFSFNITQYAYVCPDAPATQIGLIYTC